MSCRVRVSPKTVNWNVASPAGGVLNVPVNVPLRSQNRISSAERRYVTASADNIGFAAAEQVDGGHGFPWTPTETAWTDSGHSVLGVASLGQVRSPVPGIGDFDLGDQGERNGGSLVLRSLLPGVPMVQTTQTRH